MPVHQARQIDPPDNDDGLDCLPHANQSGPHTLAAQRISPQRRHRAPRGGELQQTVHRSKAMLKDLAQISLEMAQIVTAESDGQTLPAWYMVEIVRDLPRLVEARDTRDTAKA